MRARKPLLLTACLLAVALLAPHAAALKAYGVREPTHLYAVSPGEPTPPHPIRGTDLFLTVTPFRGDVTVRVYNEGWWPLVVRDAAQHGKPVAVALPEGAHHFVITWKGGPQPAVGQWTLAASPGVARVVMVHAPSPPGGWSSSPSQPASSDESGPVHGPWLPVPASHRAAPPAGEGPAARLLPALPAPAPVDAAPPGLPAPGLPPLVTSVLRALFGR